MPIYEYQCESCEGVLEALQTISAPPLTECAECGGKLDRIFSPPSLNVGRYVSGTAERHTRKLNVMQQAKQEEERLKKHSEQTGVRYSDLFEDHEHH